MTSSWSIRLFGVALPILSLALPTSSFANETEAAFSEMLERINANLAAEQQPYRAAMLDYVTDVGQEAGNRVISKDVGNKQTDFHFVPFDERRPWSLPDNGTDSITYAVDTTEDAIPPLPAEGGLTAAETDAAIDRATSSWEAVECSDLAITRVSDFGIDIGVAAFDLGLGGSPFVFADVQHAGWGDLDFGGTVLAMTITFGFVDARGNFTDVDRNGKFDASFREIYYDPSFPWADDGRSNVDVESIALHEGGHGLGQDHFGKIFIDNNGVLRHAPLAAMNAAYTGPQRELLGTDNGGHCSIWGSWPGN